MKPEHFSGNRIRKIVSSMDANLETMKQKLFHDIKIFKENQAQSDDMTMIILRQWS